MTRVTVVRNRRCASGFTLLELLVALVLCAVLMGGLWSLFSTYERLFSRGQTKVEQAQLARTLLEQFSSDLQSAIPDYAPPGPGQTPSLRRFGLFGTARALQVDVLQVSPTQLIAPVQPLDPALTAAVANRVPELHTVQYLFEGSAQAADGLEPSRQTPGLLRRELDWEATRKGQAEPGAAGPQPPARPEAVEPLDFLTGEFDPEDNSVLRVPEVVGLEFRYYDGGGWSGQWNSLTQKSLPVAIEIKLTLQTAEPGRPARRAAPSGFEVEPPEGQANERPRGQTETHRLLVLLAGTTLGRPVEVPQTGPQTGPRRRPAGPPRPAPPPRLEFRPPALPTPPALPPTPGASAAEDLKAVMPEQWMRSGS